MSNLHIQCCNKNLINRICNKINNIRVFLRSTLNFVTRFIDSFLATYSLISQDASFYIIRLNFLLDVIQISRVAHGVYMRKLYHRNFTIVV